MPQTVGKSKTKIQKHRLVFGQPRQEELISNVLERKMSDDDIKDMTDVLVINLAPLILNN